MSQVLLDHSPSKLNHPMYRALFCLLNSSRGKSGAPVIVGSKVVGDAANRSAKPRLEKHAKLAIRDARMMDTGGVRVETHVLQSAHDRQRKRAELKCNPRQGRASIIKPTCQPLHDLQAMALAAQPLLPTSWPYCLFTM